ncbi:MAG: division/cell wall cluster transcriptional repressor MraZ [Bdellovibrionaceae bacterium]|jgi:MraZ protein|nr:division/cell wall cluster transcriptional repressor MraZ [Pseudobdellovibrionaceae bacterium]
MNFRGRFFCKLDAKGRLSLPSAYGFKKNLKQTLVITNARSANQKFLDVYPLKEWEKLEKKILKMPSLNKNVQAFQRFYVSSGQVVESDSQGRLLVPLSLRDYSQLDAESEVVIVGMGHKLEIWNSKEWDKLFSKIEASYEEVVEFISNKEEGNK